MGEGVTLMTVELIADTRGDLCPDPRHDAVLAVALLVRRRALYRRQEPQPKSPSILPLL